MSDEPISSSTPSLPYATPNSAKPNHWPAAILIFAALGLIGLGGCFLIGVLLVYIDSPKWMGSNVLTDGQLILLVVLYAATAGCFGTAITLLIMGIRRLR